MQVSDFMEKLSRQTKNPGMRTFNSQTRKIEKLSLNHPVHLGRYQVFPFNYAVTDFPFVSGLDRQVNMPRTTTDQEGKTTSYQAWIHIPHKDFYQMKDETGRAVSSLTAEDEKILDNAINLWEELYKELDGKNNWGAIKDIIRRRNYTLFSGYCLNFWKYGSTNPRVPDRQNFSALFMITSKGFATMVENNISDKSIMEGSDQTWLERVYNNKLKDRDGFLLFSINKDKDRAGFVTTAQHEFGHDQLRTIEVPQDDFDAGMTDPVSLFLGWQGSSQDNDKPCGTRRLFNAKLMKETVDYLVKVLTAVRAAKEAGTDYMAAIERVNNSILEKAGEIDANVAPAAVTMTAQPAMSEPTQPQSAQIDPLAGSGFGGFGGFNSPTPEPAKTPDFNNPEEGFDPVDNSGLPF